MYRSTIIILICMVVFGIVASDAAEAADHQAPSSALKVADIKFNVMAFASGGIIIGEAADFISRYSSDVTDKVIYGGGVSAIYFVNPNIGFAFNLQRGFKTIPIRGGESGRGWLYSVSFMANFHSQVKSTAYARFDAGFVTGKYPDYEGDVDLELGSHPYFRFSLGVFSLLSRKLNMKTELYYLTALSDGYEIEQLGGAEIPFNATCFGVELGFGFPLKKR